jgi:hypothetical protein
MLKHFYAGAISDRSSDSIRSESALACPINAAFHPRGAILEPAPNFLIGRRAAAKPLSARAIQIKATARGRRIQIERKHLVDRIRLKISVGSGRAESVRQALHRFESAFRSRGKAGSISLYRYIFEESRSLRDAAMV